MRGNAETAQAVQIEILIVGRRGLQQDLKLIEMLETVRIVAVSPIRRASHRLHIRRLPRLGTECPQGGCGVKGAGADLHIVGL